MRQDEFKVLMELKQLYEFLELMNKDKLSNPASYFVVADDEDEFLRKVISKEIDSRLQFLGYE